MKKLLTTNGEMVTTTEQTKAIAEKLINDLKEVFTLDRFQFDSQVAQRIAGDSNKPIRQEIVKQLTGEIRPLTKCGMYAVSNVMQEKFTQFNLF